MIELKIPIFLWILMLCPINFSPVANTEVDNFLLSDIENIMARDVPSSDVLAPEDTERDLENIARQLELFITLGAGLTITENLAERKTTVEEIAVDLLLRKMLHNNSKWENVFIKSDKPPDQALSIQTKQFLDKSLSKLKNLQKAFTTNMYRKELVGALNSLPSYREMIKYLDFNGTIIEKVRDAANYMAYHRVRPNKNKPLFYLETDGTRYEELKYLLDIPEAIQTYERVIGKRIEKLEFYSQLSSIDQFIGKEKLYWRIKNNTECVARQFGEYFNREKSESQFSFVKFSTCLLEVYNCHLNSVSLRGSDTSSDEYQMLLLLDFINGFVNNSTEMQAEVQSFVDILEPFLKQFEQENLKAMDYHDESLGTSGVFFKFLESLGHFDNFADLGRVLKIFESFFTMVEAVKQNTTKLGFNEFYADKFRFYPFLEVEQMKEFYKSTLGNTHINGNYRKLEDRLKMLKVLTKNLGSLVSHFDGFEFSKFFKFVIPVLAEFSKELKFISSIELREIAEVLTKMAQPLTKIIENSYSWLKIVKSYDWAARIGNTSIGFKTDPRSLTMYRKMVKRVNDVISWGTKFVKELGPYFTGKEREWNTPNFELDVRFDAVMRKMKRICDAYLYKSVDVYDTLREFVLQHDIETFKGTLSEDAVFIQNFILKTNATFTIGHPGLEAVRHFTPQKANEAVDYLELRVKNDAKIAELPKYLENKTAFVKNNLEKRHLNIEAEFWSLENFEVFVSTLLDFPKEFGSTPWIEPSNDFKNATNYDGGNNFFGLMKYGLEEYKKFATRVGSYNKVWESFQTGAVPLDDTDLEKMKKILKMEQILRPSERFDIIALLNGVHETRKTLNSMIQHIGEYKNDCEGMLAKMVQIPNTKGINLGRYATIYNFIRAMGNFSHERFADYARGFESIVNLMVEPRKGYEREEINETWIRGREDKRKLKKERPRKGRTDANAQVEDLLFWVLVVIIPIILCFGFTAGCFWFVHCFSRLQATWTAAEGFYSSIDFFGWKIIGRAYWRSVYHEFHALPLSPVKLDLLFDKKLMTGCRKPIELYNRNRLRTKNNEFYHASKCNPLFEHWNFKLIAAQAPTLATIETFFNIIIENQVFFIVQLCSDEEMAEDGMESYSMKKLSQKYSGKTKLEKSELVATTKHYEHRMLTISYTVVGPKGRETRKAVCVNHFLVPNIPDYGVPEEPEVYVDLITKIMDTVKDTERIFVHCLDGTGRTMTFMTVLNFMVRFQRESAREIVIAEIIETMRNDRYGAVETYVQYGYIWLSILYFLASLDEVYMDDYEKYLDKYQNDVDKMNYESEKQIRFVDIQWPRLELERSKLELENIDNEVRDRQQNPFFWFTKDRLDDGRSTRTLE